MSEERWHGTTGGYSNHACRCDLCTTANRSAHREYMRSHPEARAKAAEYYKAYIQRPEVAERLKAQRQMPKNLKRERNRSRATRGESDELQAAHELVWRLKNEAGE